MGLSKSDCEPCRACRRVLWVFDKHVLLEYPSGTQIHLVGVGIEAADPSRSSAKIQQPATIISVTTRQTPRAVPRARH